MFRPHRNYLFLLSFSYFKLLIPSFLFITNEVYLLN